jgi:hypothetical protein
MEMKENKKTYTFYFGSYEQLKDGRCEYDRENMTLAEAREQVKTFGGCFARLGKNGKLNIVK